MLPFAAAIDSRQLQRFQNEALAAAHLRHENIVPVYAVGSERGVHYYAMQFVEGESLAGLIRELRQKVRPNDECPRTNDQRMTECRNAQCPQESKELPNPARSSRRRPVRVFVIRPWSFFRPWEFVIRHSSGRWLTG